MRIAVIGAGKVAEPRGGGAIDDIRRPDRVVNGTEAGFAFHTVGRA